MENFKALKLLCAVEKVFNIHRDYLYLRNRTRFFIKIGIFLEIIISAHFYTISLNFFSSKHWFFLPLFYASIIMNTLSTLQSVLSALYFGPRNGKIFRKLLLGLSLCQEIVKRHPPYIKWSSTLKMKCKLAMFIYAGIRVLLIVVTTRFAYLLNEFDTCFNVLSFISFNIYEKFTENRYVLELLVFYSLLYEIKFMLQAVNALVKDTDTLENNLNNVAKVYRQLLDCGRLFKECFGHHVSRYYRGPRDYSSSLNACTLHLTKRLIGESKRSVNCAASSRPKYLRT